MAPFNQPSEKQQDQEPKPDPIVQDARVISASPLRAVVKVTESERREDNESDDELERDNSERQISPTRKSVLRDDSESMRTERENFIQGFENSRKISVVKPITTRSERAPELAQENLKGIIQTELTKPDISNLDYTPIKTNYDDMSQSELEPPNNKMPENYLQIPDFSNQRNVMDQFKQRSQALRQQREQELTTIYQKAAVN